MHACILLVICIALRSTFLQPCFHNATLGFAQMPTTRQTLRNKWCLCTAEDVITEEWRNFVIEAAETYGAEIGKYLRVKPVQDTHLQMVRQMVCLGEILIGVLTVQTSMCGIPDAPASQKEPGFDPEWFSKRDHILSACRSLPCLANFCTASLPSCFF